MLSLSNTHAHTHTLGMLCVCCHVLWIVSLLPCILIEVINSLCPLNSSKIQLITSFPLFLHLTSLFVFAFHWLFLQLSVYEEGDIGPISARRHFLCTQTRLNILLLLFSLFFCCTYALLEVYEFDEQGRISPICKVSSYWREITVNIHLPVL